MKIHNIGKYKVVECSADELSENQQNQIIEFCELIDLQKGNMLENWKAKDWQQRPHSLLNTIFCQKRFDHPTGQIYLLQLGGELISISGVYRFSEDPDNILIGGVRTITRPDRKDVSLRDGHSFIHSEVLLPLQAQWGREHGYSVFALTFNESNKSLLTMLQRFSSGRTALVGVSISEKVQNFYSDFELYPRMLLIKNTRQFFYFKNLGEKRYDFNLSRIEV